MKGKGLSLSKVLIVGGWLYLGLISPIWAQTLDIVDNLGSGVLVSKPALPPQQAWVNLEQSLVDIKAVDKPGLMKDGNEMRLGEAARYGQGVIIDSSGVIATNKHIIQQADKISVVLSGGKVYEARVLRFSETDICLIKIETPYPLKSLTLADSKQVRVGNQVIAVANAGTTLNRKKQGEVIDLLRDQAASNAEILQMNIPLNPGDSGGAILSENGLLVGLIVGKQLSHPDRSIAIASSRIQQEYFQYKNSILN